MARLLSALGNSRPVHGRRATKCTGPATRGTRPAGLPSGTSAYTAGCFLTSPALAWPQAHVMQELPCPRDRYAVQVAGLPRPSLGPSSPGGGPFAGCRPYGQDRSAVRVFAPSPGVGSMASAPSKPGNWWRRRRFINLFPSISVLTVSGPARMRCNGTRSPPPGARRTEGLPRTSPYLQEAVPSPQKRGGAAALYFVRGVEGRPPGGLGQHEYPSTGRPLAPTGGSCRQAPC